MKYLLISLLFVISPQKSWAEELIDYNKKMKDQCDALGGVVYFSPPPGDCGEYSNLIWESKVDALSEHGSRSFCCAPKKGITYLRSEEECLDRGGYLSRAQYEKPSCKSGDQVIGELVRFSSLHRYFCCK